MTSNKNFSNLINISLQKLDSYVNMENFKGWDPYDGLNSEVFRNIPLLKNNKYIRLAWIQFFKRSPLNFRKIFLVEKNYNSKGIALFLNSYCIQYKIDKNPETLNKIYQFADLLLSLKSKGWSGDCWGYNFDWQAKAFFQPAYTPTVVASVYAASALSEAYDITNEKKYLDSVLSCGDFILNDLQRTYDENGDFCFSYSPLDKTKVFNASLLGAKLLAIIFKLTNIKSYKDEAQKAVNYVCRRQSQDGSWVYGEQPFHQWIDNFHTGFNLECISDYQNSTKDFSFQKNLNQGLDYYINTFFLQDGRAKYYNNKIYPIDIHSPAQLIITLHKLKKAKEYESVYTNVIKWTIEKMQDQNGYFYYQRKKFISSKIPYMRWAQAWMYYALSTTKQINHEN